MPIQDNQALDDVISTDGDSAFLGGQVSGTAPNGLPAGTFAEALNMDFDAFGRLVTRRGTKAVIGNIDTSTWDTTDATTWSAGETELWSQVATGACDAGYFFDTQIAEYTILAQNGNLLYGGPAQAYSTISGATYTGREINFATMGNRLYYADGTAGLRYIDAALANTSITAGKISRAEITDQGRGYTTAPTVTLASASGSGATFSASLAPGGRVVNVSVTSQGSGYANGTVATLTAAPSGGATATIVAHVSQTPTKPLYLTSHANRLICATADTSIDADTLYISDILDGDSWDLLGSSIRVGGNGDPITGIYSWFSNFLLVFKESSIWVVDCNPLQDVSDWKISLVSGGVGCLSHKSIRAVGKDVFFASREGMRSVSQLDSGVQNAVGITASNNVSDIFERLNLAAADKIRSISYGNRLFIALPLDGSTVANYTLIYHAISQTWLGLWKGWSPRDLFTTAFGGQKKLNIADDSGALWVWDDYTLLANETQSEYRDGTAIYESYVKTRGYNHGDPLANKLGHAVQIHLENRLTDMATTAYLKYDKDMSGAYASLDSAINVPSLSKLTRKSKALISFGKFNIIQFQVGALQNKVTVNSIATTAFVDTLNPEI